MSFKRRGASLLLALVALLALAACDAGDVPEPSSSSPSSPLVTVAPTELALPRTSATLHPILGVDRTNLDLAPLLWEGLFELDNTFTSGKVLCESYTTSADGLIWTFRLRAGVTFSDGAPLTAQEAVASLELARTSSRYAPRMTGVVSVRPVDAQTLVITLSSPNGSLPALLDIPIVKGESEEPLGTGPYVMDSWGETARLVRRSGWWRGEPLPLESIALRTVDGADNLIYAFDTNDISLVTTDLTGTNALGYSTGYETWDCPSTTMLYVGFNTAKGPCADQTVRQALSRSFDRATLATALYARHALAAVLPVSPKSPLYSQALAEQNAYSAQAAAEQLAQAGYALTDGVLYKGRSALSLTLLVGSENNFRTAAADYLAEQLRGLGITVELRKLGWADYEKALKAGGFDLYLAETMLTGDFDLTPLLAQNGGLNYGGYHSGEAAARLAEFRAAEPEDRTAASQALYETVLREAPIAPLCFKNASVLTQWGLISGLSPTRANAFYEIWSWRLTEG